jgi:hypothetical protein
MSFLFIKEAQLLTHDCDPGKEYGRK